jgi:hypothetical protein
VPGDEQVTLEGVDAAVDPEGGDRPGEVEPRAGRAVVPFSPALGEQMRDLVQPGRAGSARSGEECRRRRRPSRRCRRASTFHRPIAGVLEGQQPVALRLIGLYVDKSTIRVDSFVLHLVPPRGRSVTIPSTCDAIRYGEGRSN